jgi:glycosyltransferase involved in cell wall biosynthesis
MKKLRITMVLPAPALKPGGGVKIIYEYANRLQERGHQVTIVHSIRRPFIKIRSPLWWKQLIYTLKKAGQPKWFSLHKNIRSLIVPEITDAYVPDGDVVLCTWWEMAYMISKLNSSKGSPFNLIQDYEIWGGKEDLVQQSYCLPVQNIVIAKYLQQLVASYCGKQPIYVPNAINLNKFRITIPIEKREPHRVIMLYSIEPRKGTVYGLEALTKVKNEVPDLTVDLFGVPEKPLLPDWMQYHRKPPDLPQLMNSAAIFFSPSLGEGWALPPAEAMACGCAVVCTAIGGHADYAIDRETALLIPPKDVSGMTTALCMLLNNQPLRINIAQQSQAFLTTNFSWETSVKKMETVFLETLPD